MTAPAEHPALLALDFDGVLTDNTVLVRDDGSEAVVCSRADGLGFDMLRHAGIPCVVLSTERNAVVSRRCEKLQIQCVQGISDKAAALEDVCRRAGISTRSAWYVGNDLNDLAALKVAGRAFCPADAHPAVRSASQTVLPVNGGAGVVRAIVDDILRLDYLPTRTRAAIFVTVRTGSTRLPNKCVLDLHGERVVEFLVRRLKRSRLADLIVICTTTRAEDDVLSDIAATEQVKCWRGSERDKLERWREAAAHYGVDFFVTADGDDPFCEPELIDLAIEQFGRSRPDFIQTEGLAVGAFTYGIKRSALEKVCSQKDTDDTEMMWVYFTQVQGFVVESLEHVPAVFKRPEIRMTLDYEDDMRFFRTVVEYFVANGNRGFTLRDVITYLDSHPEVIAINQYLQERFLANQQARTKLSLKQGSQ